MTSHSAANPDTETRIGGALPQSLKDEIRAMAKAQGRSLSSELRLAVQGHVDRARGDDPTRL